MKLIVGLGNPGGKYSLTRHNVGFMVIDRIIREVEVSPHVDKRSNSLVFYNHDSKTIFAKPEEFMNQSGKSVKKLIDYYKVKIGDLWVIHDDLDIKLGSYKTQVGKGPKDHKGVLSIEKELGKKNFKRIRIGVENREEKKVSGETYVLQKFKSDELDTVRKVIIKIVKEIKDVLD